MNKPNTVGDIENTYNALDEFAIPFLRENESRASEDDRLFGLLGELRQRLSFTFRKAYNRYTFCASQSLQRRTLICEQEWQRKVAHYVTSHVYSISPTGDIEYTGMRYVRRMLPSSSVLSLFC